MRREPRLALVRVAFDAHVVGERETGNETYAFNLLRALTADTEGVEYQVFTPHPERLSAVLNLPQCSRLVRVWPAASLLRIPVGMPVAVRRWQSNVLHVS